MMEERYIYTVVPRRPIRNIVKGKVITRSTNLSLSKEEVLECLKLGAKVSRKFYLDETIRVNANNLDRYHRAENLNDKEWERLCQEQATEPQEEQPKEEVTSEVTDETSITEDENVAPDVESVEEANIIEEVKEETPIEEIPEEDIQEVPEEVVEIKKVEEEQSTTGVDDVTTTAEETPVIEDLLGSNSRNNSRNRKKKKNNRNNNYNSNTESSDVPKTTE